jgi:23S rRNA pseudouridine2605 synthase
VDDDVAAQQHERHYYAVLNKPGGVICTTRDPTESEHLGPWLARMPPGTFPVGRLDRETTGLLLFTTDGDLADAVLRPQHHTSKVYWLWLDEHLPPGDPRLEALLCQTDPRYDGAVGVEVVRCDEHSSELHLTLDRGKHRQIRRMCRALRLHLLHLHRKRIGPLALGSLELGGVRQLDSAEVGALWRSTGHIERASTRKHAALVRQAQQLREQGKPHLRLEAWLSRADVAATASTSK